MAVRVHKCTSIRLWVWLSGRGSFSASHLSSVPQTWRHGGERARSNFDLIDERSHLLRIRLRRDQIVFRHVRASALLQPSRLVLSDTTTTTTTTATATATATRDKAEILSGSLCRNQSPVSRFKPPRASVLIAPPHPQAALAALYSTLEGAQRGRGLRRIRNSTYVRTHAYIERYLRAD